MNLFILIPGWNLFSLNGEFDISKISTELGGVVGRSADSTTRVLLSPIELFLHFNEGSGSCLSGCWTEIVNYYTRLEYFINLVDPPGQEIDEFVQFVLFLQCAVVF